MNFFAEYSFIYYNWILKMNLIYFIFHKFDILHLSHTLAVVNIFADMFCLFKIPSHVSLYLWYVKLISVLGVKCVMALCAALSPRECWPACSCPAFSCRPLWPRTVSRRMSGVSWETLRAMPTSTKSLRIFVRWSWSKAWTPWLCLTWRLASPIPSSVSPCHLPQQLYLQVIYFSRHHLARLSHTQKWPVLGSVHHLQVRGHQLHCGGQHHGAHRHAQPQGSNGSLRRSRRIHGSWGG